MKIPASRREGRSISPPARSPSREVVSRSCHALGRPHEAGKFTEYLQSQWVEDLSDLTDEDWRELQLPLGLKSEMRRQVCGAEDGATPKDAVRNGDTAAPVLVSREKAEDPPGGPEDMTTRSGSAGSLAAMQRNLAQHCSVSITGLVTGSALFTISVAAMIAGFGDLFSLRNYLVGLYNCFYAVVIMLCNAHGNGSSSSSSRNAILVALHRKWWPRVKAWRQRLLGVAPFLGDPRGLAIFYVHVGLQLLILQPETSLWRALFIMVGCLLAILAVAMVFEARANNHAKSVGNQKETKCTSIAAEEGRTDATHSDGCSVDGFHEKVDGVHEKGCGSPEAAQSPKQAAYCNSEGGQSGCCSPLGRTSPAPRDQSRESSLGAVATV